MKSIHEEVGRKADARVTIDQIGPQTLMSVGAQLRKTAVRDDANGMIKFKVSGRYWLTVKLMADDTYAVEVATVRKMEYKVIEQERGVHAEDLAKVVRQLGDRA